MDTDNYQQAWRTQSSAMRVKIDGDLLRKAVQRDDRTFRTMIFWQDCRAVGIALLMLPVWFFLGVMYALPWTWYLAVPALVWVAGFILVDRMRHRQQPYEAGESLLHGLKGSLSQVEHQIWLLRNIFWWYLLPCAISLPAFCAHVVWRRPGDWRGPVGSLFFVAVLYAMIYFLNRLSVRWQLEPRRRELLSLLATLRDEDDGGQFVMPRKSTRVKKPGRPLQPFVLASFCSVAIMLIAVAGGLFHSSEDVGSRITGPAGFLIAGPIADLR